MDVKRTLNRDECPMHVVESPKTVTVLFSHCLNFVPDYEIKSLMAHGMAQIYEEFY